jgi:hypothetical protein
LFIVGSDATTGSTIVVGAAHAEIVKALQIKRTVPSLRIIYIHLYFTYAILTIIDNQRNSANLPIRLELFVVTLGTI